MHRSAFTVALVGADGAGKTTIARRLERERPHEVKYLYMGVNGDAGNRMLPTTRAVRLVKRALGRARPAGGPPDPGRVEHLHGSRPPARRAGSAVRGGLRLANTLAEEWYRQAVAWSYLRRGSIVVFDRHFIADYFDHGVRGGSARSVGARLHGLTLRTLYPTPDLVVCLDAPAEVLFARKAEGTIESLTRRREEYLDLARRDPSCVVIDATRPLDEVASDVSAAVAAFGSGAAMVRT